ncbi:RNA-directed DNA polymerase from transposon X-element [Penicillium bovifimosum]|uniref:RNA-directed DNA polymerase from transposon X-element n=1 Tax=Penicillium bovifimosum TaxID=126998 RepID=A0A9W9GU35_9EURO|nr:RNA-directed DNA polymerase from transposon X-element [Penicillium bovifimosum]KAJ5129943.1 RNA-directed DNA polymerase from transposon X-element [Penicillium bovifimosum]
MPKIWLCVDSTSVIWCIRETAPTSSQWAFLNCQQAIDTHGVGVRWAPGHISIEGDEASDRLVAAGADMELDGPEALPTVSGIGSLFRDMKKAQQQEWWMASVGKLSVALQARPVPCAGCREPVRRFVAFDTHVAWRPADADSTGIYCLLTVQKGPL